VIGDRRWLYGFSGPVLSKPEPFSRMPICYERALGGLTGMIPRSPMPNPYNPVGTGHALCKQPMMSGPGRANRYCLRTCDERFYFSASGDQCFNGFLRGGEAMILHGLSPAGTSGFRSRAYPCIAGHR